MMGWERGEKEPRFGKGDGGLVGICYPAQGKSSAFLHSEHPGTALREVKIRR